MARAYMEVFVSTGRKNAMFTLRTARIHSGDGFFFTREAYIKNLSTDAEKAEELAMEYTKEMAARIGGPDFEVYYVGMETEEIFKRRGKLSVMDTKAIEDLENGFVPFGKHKGTKLVDLPDTYILWLTDSLKSQEDMKPGFFAFCTVASGIANERGLMAIREQKRAERDEQEAKSNHFGIEGKRYTEEVEIVYANYDNESGYFNYYIRLGDDILFHNGRTELPKGKVKLTFTVKFHNLTRKGVKKTYINRPKVEK